MADCIWYIGAAHDVSCSRGFMPGDFDGPERAAIFHSLNTIKQREMRGELSDPKDIPTAYQPVRTDPKKNLPLPLWHSTLLQVRQDVVDVMQDFDLGLTQFVPITVLMPDGTVRDDFSTFSIANQRQTIDDAASERIRSGHLLRPSLLGKSPHPSVFAHRHAMEGPALWRDPKVLNTVFVRDDLANALRAAEFGRALKVKKIRLSPT